MAVNRMWYNYPQERPSENEFYLVRLTQLEAISHSVYEPTHIAIAKFDGTKWLQDGVVTPNTFNNNEVIAWSKIPS